MRKRKGFTETVMILIWLALSACGNDEAPIKATIVTPVKGASLHFRGYVTDDETELTSNIYEFSRTFSHLDTLDEQPVYVFYSNDEKNYFYTDDAGTVWQLNTVNLTKRLISYGISTLKPVIMKYWQTMLKVDNGVGTEWHVLVDTTIHGRDVFGKTAQIRYFYSAKARYEGWGQAFIPETYKFESVLDVYWYEINNYIVNQTTMDSLYIQRGTAHHYFDPELGLIKFITNYKKKEMNNSYVNLRGTWELVGRDIMK